METDREYRNKVIINQRGGTIEINNSTEREEIKVSQYSGSNITLNNLVNSELATNNKQTKVIYDEFKTVGNTLNEFTVKDRNIRVGENNYEIKGFTGENTADEIDAFTEWREEYRDIANLKSQFKIKRGGAAYPYQEAILTPLKGVRGSNPDLSNKRFAVENPFSGYTVVPNVKNDINEVVDYTPVPDYDNTDPAEERSPSVQELEKGFKLSQGIILFGGFESAATESGSWESNDQGISAKLIEKQKDLYEIEQRIGNGGDDIEAVKRNKVLNVGATINNYPSLRVDMFGRSQPTEIGVCDSSVFKHHDAIPHCEDIDNSSNFPCGNYTMTIGNRMNVIVGSGGVSIKTTGPVSIGGSSIKLGGTKVDIAGAAGVTVSSESNIDIFAKQIQFRSDKQVFFNSSMGVLNNLIIGGGLMIEGEVYLNHITAPLEVQETMPTKLYGQLVDGLLIGYGSTSEGLIPIYAVGTPDSVITYDHTHHFNNIPLRLMSSNKDMRKAAQLEEINVPISAVKAKEQIHERKLPTIVKEDDTFETSSGI